MTSAVLPDHLAHAEERLRQSEERFRQLAEAMPQLVWIARGDGVVTYYNQRAARFDGIACNPDGTWTWHPVLHPDDRPKTERVWQAAVEAGATYECEHRLRMADGNFRWHLSRAEPVVTDGTVQWFGTATDVHDLKVAEDGLRKARELEEVAARQKDQFIAVLAHELRNPLAPIRTAVALLRARGPQDPVLIRCRDVIDRQAAHMGRLLDDLLDVSRLSRGKLTLQRAPVLLRDAIDAAIDLSRPLIEQQQHTLTVEGADDTLLIDADPARLIQVFGNLLTNAAKFTPPGGHIRVTLRTEGDEVVVSVSDTGLGMSAEMLDRAFDLFTQGDGAGHPTGGLGIGLALVRHLVDMHGGTVHATSAGHGLGSEFLVRLPVGAAATDRGARPMPLMPNPSWPRKRVLIADDNRDAADMLGALFEELGCEVQTVHDGESAVRVAASFRPDVAVLDLGMPQVSGFEACRRIRGEPWGGGMVLVALTGLGQEHDRARTAQAGFDAHVVKPVDPMVLLQRVRELETRSA